MLSRRIFCTQIRCMCTKNNDKYRQVPKLPPNVRGANLFNRVFGKYLFLTNTLTSGFLMGIGDIFQQEVEYRRHMLPERYDWARTVRMLLVGFSMGPLHHFFYKYLDHYIPKRNVFSITKKILLDQLIMSPVCIGWFFYGMGALERKTMSDITGEVNEKFVEVYLIDWSVWPPTQFINFYFLPVQYQVLYINFVTMVYNIFLSYIKHREKAQLFRSHLKLKDNIVTNDKLKTIFD